MPVSLSLSIMAQRRMKGQPHRQHDTGDDVYSLHCLYHSRILITPYMLRMMSTPDDVIRESATYLKIYFGGVAGLMFYNMGSGVLRAVGDSRHPLYFLIFSAVVNTVLDLLFVVSFGMGIEGVALATVIAQCLSAVLTLYVLTTTDGPYRICWKKLCMTGLCCTASSASDCRQRSSRW